MKPTGGCWVGKEQMIIICIFFSLQTKIESTDSIFHDMN